MNTILNQYVVFKLLKLSWLGKIIHNMSPTILEDNVFKPCVVAS